MKISAFKSKWVMIVAQHYYDREKFFIQQFSNHDEAANFIDELVKKEISDEH